MPRLGSLHQMRERQKKAYARLRKGHRGGMAKAGRDLAATTTAILRAEINAARIAPARKGKESARAQTCEIQPTLI